MTTQLGRASSRQQSIGSAAHVPETTHDLYGQLVSLGLDPGEAAQLTAYLNGLRASRGPWTLTQVNTMLFLRHLYRAGIFGPEDGLTPTGSIGR